MIYEAIPTFNAVMAERLCWDVARARIRIARHLQSRSFHYVQILGSAQVSLLGL
jgi:hypothetical protein